MKCSVEACLGQSEGVAQLMVSLPETEPTLYRLTEQGFVPVIGLIRVLAPVCGVHRRGEHHIPVRFDDDPVPPDGSTRSR